MAGEMTMKCPKCGRENEAGASFCSVCGSQIGGGQLQAATAIQPQVKHNSSTVLISVIVVIVVVIIAIGAIAAYVAMRTVNDVATTDISMSVVSAKEVVDPLFSPSVGSRFVQLTVTMTNNERSTTTLSPFEFHILASDGSSYDYTLLIDDTVPSGLAAGSTATFSITFVVPTDKTPTKLTYQALFSTNLVETAIGSVNPPVIQITLAVTGATLGSGSYGPSIGNKYVLVNFTMTNGYTSTLSLSVYDFKLQTANGTIYDYSFWVDYDVPSGLAAGATGSMSIGFEIPTSATAQKLIFESGNLHVEATVP